MLTGLLKIINGKLHYRDSMDRMFEPVPEVNKPWGVRITPDGKVPCGGLFEPGPAAYGGGREGGKSVLTAANMQAFANGRREGYAVGLVSGRREAAPTMPFSALQEANKWLRKALVTARERADFWKDVAARRKERCDYLATEMRKYRDQPRGVRIKGLEDYLSAHGASSLVQLVAQRDTADTQVETLRAELAQLRLVNDKLQKAVEDAAGVRGELNQHNQRLLTRLRGAITLLTRSRLTLDLILPTTGKTTSIVTDIDAFLAGKSD